MNHKAYFCFDCATREAGRSIYDLPVPEFRQLINKHTVANGVCPVCSGSNLKQIFGIADSYVKGYGFADKKGAKRDIDMHAMANGNDPYGEHRKAGEARDVILNLQRLRERDTKRKTILFGR